MVTMKAPFSRQKWSHHRNHGGIDHFVSDLIMVTMKAPFPQKMWIHHPNHCRIDHLFLCFFRFDHGYDKGSIFRKKWSHHRNHGGIDHLFQI